MQNIIFLLSKYNHYYRCYQFEFYNNNILLYKKNDLSGDGYWLVIQTIFHMFFATIYFSLNITVDKYHFFLKILRLLAIILLVFNYCINLHNSKYNNIFL